MYLKVLWVVTKLGIDRDHMYFKLFEQKEILQTFIHDLLLTSDSCNLL